MLSHQRRQHPSENHSLSNNNNNNFPYNYDLPLRLPTSASNFLAPVPAESDIARLSHSPSSTLESSPAISTLDYPESAADYYSPRGYPRNHPQRSSLPNSQSASTQSQSSAQPTTDHGRSAQSKASSWSQQPNAASQLISQRIRRAESHRRNLSDSTATSVGGSQSPYTPVSAPGYPQIFDPESQAYFSQPFEPVDHSLPTSYPKSISTAHPVITDHLYYSPQFQGFPPQYVEDQSGWGQQITQSMSQAQQYHRQHHQQQQQVSYGQGQHPFPGGNVNLRMSQSSVERSAGGEAVTNHGRNNHKRSTVGEVAPLDRTMSDIYQEQLFNPIEPVVPTRASKPSTPKVKVEEQSSPRNSIFSERLHEAEQSHMSAAQSTSAALSRDKSPFRADSPYSPVSRLAGSAAAIREQQNAMEAQAMAMAQRGQNGALENQRRTVSPKEMSLEYEPEDEHADNNNASTASFVPTLSSPPRGHARSQGPSKLKQELTQSNSQSYDEQLAQLRRESSSNLSNGSSRTQQNGIPQMPQHYPFIGRQRRQNSHTPAGQESVVPPFPQHSLSMESTKSEHHSASSHSQSHSDSDSHTLEDQSDADADVKRPLHTTADTGTYTCTYHGCTQRFETPARLQRHKREGHRQGTPNSASDTSSRLTQAGPHKCERINPSTGKPCNSVFSRPYDLTRHEDTIHNARKQKVRCQLCVEEKTFSRNDALTRHMRVVHPEVDFPGKHKRRGA